jgi:hypothetical protein
MSVSSPGFSRNRNISAPHRHSGNSVDPGNSKFSNTDIATPQNGARGKFEANIVPQRSKSISAVSWGASAKLRGRNWRRSRIFVTRLAAELPARLHLNVSAIWPTFFSLSERVKFHLGVTKVDVGRGIWGAARSLQPIRKRPPYWLPLRQANSLRENAIFVRVSSLAEHLYLSVTHERVRRFIIFET